MEKPASPPLPVPPPKPPRQKSGSIGSNASSNKPSPAGSRIGSARLSNGRDVKEIIEQEIPMQENPMEINDNENKSAGSEKSRSTKSKTDTDETVPLETTIQNSLDDIDNLKDKAVQEIEEKLDLIADDADVVQSPPPRTGNSTLFILII